MKEKYIIEIESTSKSDFGIVFMREILEKIVMVLNGWRKCYKATMRRIDG